LVIFDIYIHKWVQYNVNDYVDIFGTQKLNQKLAQKGQKMFFGPYK